MSAPVNAAAAGRSPLSTLFPKGERAQVSPTRLAQIRKTAQQFEAIFVRQMLSAAHKSGFGETMTSSQGTDTFRDMQDARFADIAAQKGAFGLAKMIEKQLVQRETDNLPIPPAGPEG